MVSSVLSFCGPQLLSLSHSPGWHLWALRFSSSLQQGMHRLRDNMRRQQLMRDLVIVTRDWLGWAGRDMDSVMSDHSWTPARDSWPGAFFLTLPKNPVPNSGAAYTSLSETVSCREKSSEPTALKSGFTKEKTWSDCIYLELTRLAFLLSGRMGIKIEMKFT